MEIDLLGQRHDEIFRHELAEQLGEELFGLHVGHFASDAFAQRIGIECGFEVEDELNAFLIDKRVDRRPADPQCHGALDAALGES